jgi:hypothetical protein
MRESGMLDVAAHLISVQRLSPEAPFSLLFYPSG